MRVDIIAPGELDSAGRTAWRRMQRGIPGLESPFLSPEFACAIAAVRPRTRVAVLTDADSSGFFPFERTGRGHAGALGMGLTDTQAMLIGPVARFDVGELLAVCGLRSFVFDHLRNDDAGAFAGARARTTAEVSQILDLTAGYDAWVADRREASHSIFSSSARKTRKLQREHGEVQFLFDHPDHGILDWLMDRKSDQYRRTSRRDRFAEPAMRRFAHDLLEHRAADFRATLSVMTAGGTVVAAHFGLRSSSTLAWWFPVYDTAFRAYSPGMLLCLAITRALAADGGTILDLGKGDEPYKERLSNNHIGLLSGYVSATTTAHVLRTVTGWPREQVTAMVQASPTMRSGARRVLARIGRWRTRHARLAPAALTPSDLAVSRSVEQVVLA
jgi:CelD/BcsL family acetyltransferase involved in cellulose biosynthesis